jgi:hypothetical protein
MTMKSGGLPFNRVVVQTSEGTRRLTVSEFEAISLIERVRALLEKRVEFFRDHERVAQQDALRALRERSS